MIAVSGMTGMMTVMIVMILMTVMTVTVTALCRGGRSTAALPPPLLGFETLPPVFVCFYRPGDDLADRFREQRWCAGAQHQRVRGVFVKTACQASEGWVAGCEVWEIGPQELGSDEVSESAGHFSVHECEVELVPIGRGHRL
eukprot:TRINITY_DN1382_c1_g1_i2.p2 TRINITY_DN1382_c1_g1~~TRINITY_DN1382_c1_g1_i2.p2  ORF type:complete len:142 (-),score=13.43 TRINITY_DN1382_c1_g1_i2:746-1171(-)